MDIKSSIIPEEYITTELASKTKYKSIKNAYDRRDLTVIVRGSFWYAEGCTEKLLITVKKEMKRLFPNLIYRCEA